MPWYFYNNRGVLKQDGLPDPLAVGLISGFVSTDNPALVPPTGWLLCDGSVHLTATYPDLAAVLAYPAAPGVNFAVPNMNTRLPVCTSGPYPLGSTGGLSQHPHTINSHTHSNDHHHGVTTTHAHKATHHHNSDGTHTHPNGGYAVGTSNANVSVQLSADTDTSTPGHSHVIGGSTGAPSPVLGDPDILLTSTVVTSQASGSGTSGADTVALGSTTPSISPVVDTLPPYLNVYYIIKAVDFSGTYI